MRLLYNKPAEKWVEALPLGNGRIGAMVFSIPDRDVFMLNEDTLWSGYPRDTNVADAADYNLKALELVKQKKYKEAEECIEDHMLGGYTQSYMPLGDLRLDFPSIDRENVTSYSRELNLNNAIVTTSFFHKGVRYKREAFVSYPDQCMIIRLSADKGQSISFSASFSSQLKSATAVEGNTALLDGICPSHVEPNYINSHNPIIYEKEDHKKGIGFRAAAIIENHGGKVVAKDNSIHVEDANSVVIKLCVRTSFNGYDKQPFLEGKDYKRDCQDDHDKIQGQPFDILKARHVEDYQELFNRVLLNLDSDKKDCIPTDRRLELFQETQDDKGLYELIFQYGRYLLIASSREGTQPANLQGIWNKEMRPPWSSNYTLNINTEMNYWPAEMCNLSELHQPLFDLIDGLRVTGAKTAKLHYGAGGFTAHHNTDIWRLSNPVGDFGRGTAGYAFWPMAAGWLCRHLFEHYEYTLDKEFLEYRAYPAISDAATFYMDMLVEDEEGYLIMSPTTSPENAFIYGGEICKVSKTATMTIAIIKEVFANFIKCCEALSIEDEMSRGIRDKISRLYPYRVGSKGQLLEWEEEFQEPEPHHRHISHIYPLYPGFEITRLETPDLAEACRKTLNLRGDDGTGWSLGWKINTWARLHDGNRALKLLKRQLRYVSESNTDYMGGGGTYANLFDAHPPFQIDGNFGACAGIAELFLQSYDDKVLILPALPDELSEGRIKGLCAKGGIVTDITFHNGGLEKMDFYTTSGESRQVTFIYKDRYLQMNIIKGKYYTINVKGTGLLTVYKGEQTQGDHPLVF